MDRQRNIAKLLDSRCQITASLENNRINTSPQTSSFSNNSAGVDMNLAFIGSCRCNAEIKMDWLYIDSGQQLLLVRLPGFRNGQTAIHRLRTPQRENSVPRNADVAHVDQDIGLIDLQNRRTANRNNNILRPTRRANSVPANADVVAYVDLSETLVATAGPLRRDRTYPINGDDDDEVVIVASNVPPVIDLCSPATENPIRPQPARRRRPIAVESQATDRNNYYTDSVANDKQLTGNDKKDSSTAASNPLICPICMESCIQGKPTSTKCGHVFCEDCIRRTITLTRKCPLCNAAMSCNNLFRLYL